MTEPDDRRLCPCGSPIACWGCGECSDCHDIHLEEDDFDDLTYEEGF